MERHTPDVSKILDKNIEMYDTYYQKPDWWFRFRYDTQVKRKTCIYLLKQVGRALNNQRVLEIGFGSGATLFSFEPDCEIYGLEISHSAITHAEEKAKKLGYKVSDFRLAEGASLSYPNEYFDVIIASHVVEHIEDDQGMLREISRVLKPAGIAVLLIPINEIYEDPNHIHHYTSMGFVELAKKFALNAVFQVENELLYHVVEKFYFEQFNYRWKIFGPLIAALFNFPTSVLPFWGYQMVERVMKSFGWKPRQFGGVFTKVLPVGQR